MKANGMNLSNSAIKNEVKEIRDILHSISVIGTKYPEVQEKIDANGGEKQWTVFLLRIAKQKIEELEDKL